MSELVHLHHKHKKDLCFKHAGNSKPAMLISIPKAKNYLTFEKNERREKWLGNILNFISNTCKDTEVDKDTVVSWLLKDIH